MIDLSILRTTDVGRAVAYVSATDSLPGRLRAWNAFVEFPTRNWRDYPDFSAYVTSAIYPEHLRFARTEEKLPKVVKKSSF